MLLSYHFCGLEGSYNIRRKLYFCGICFRNSAKDVLRVWSGEKVCSDPPKEENRVWECENKQLDSGIEIMSTILNSQVRKTGLGKEKYASRPAQGRKPGLERKKYVPRPEKGKLCQPFWIVKPGKRVWGKKNTRSDPLKEENRVWECENKQLDPGIEIMSTILGSQAQKPGLGKEKYAPRPARGRKPGLEREKYVPRPGD